jgi:uncharacterized LabA/DUF88 family protein
VAGTYVYIDGFNLYYGCVKGTPHKWLDLESFCERLLPKDNIEQIRYFTAKVSARPGEPQAPQHQETYLRALATIGKLSIHYGHFLTNSTYLPLVKVPRIGNRKAHVIKTEEKGSDVNLASHALLDGFRGRYETAVIISNDSDLREPVRMIGHELGLRVGVINPHPARKRSRELSAEAHFFKQVRVSAIATSQFPPTLTDAVGRFSKPKGW